ncbi:hypothetical protein [Paenarthrobacter sp. A20]|uniref:hypothetical protein n=1 Tax=Paenarthrobacter sp. A20 TaxID=2817891 RepID=UPI00209F0F37|nr:hypothetical protein [Paenarthrobacter sp. A20]MCP1414362.1 hypothetical protein [Paenarthrobacter sp. A20]
MRDKEIMFTHEMAENLVRCVTGTFTCEIPAAGYTEMELCTLARKLSFMVDADVRWRSLDELVVKLMELTEVEQGIHDDLELTPDGTVDNRHVLIQRIETQALELIEFVLMQAGFYPHWELAA